MRGTARTWACILAGTPAFVALATSCSSQDDSDTGLLPSGGKPVGQAGQGGTGVASGGAPSGANSGQGLGGLTLPTGGGSSRPGECKNLECKQVACQNGGKTTISGRVYDPSGTLPLYNVMVYVPNAELAPLSSGVSCACEISGEPIASAITGTDGRFVLEDAPVGNDIPLVIQVGKWRRSFMVPAVSECGDTPVPENTLRLPAKKSEGNIPKIALTTGGRDALECLMPKLGLDPSEFTNPDGDGRINYFAGHDGTPRYAAARNAGASFPPALNLWGSLEALSQYDVVLLSCEGGMYPMEKGNAAFQAMYDYTSRGGRVFASHWHQVWFQRGPTPFPQVAQFVDQPDLGNLTANVVTSFPKGQALSEWLVGVQASTTPGRIDISGAQHTVASENQTYAQRWIASESPASVQYMSANTPFGAPEAMQCGRVVLSDIHVAGDEEGGQTVDRSGTNLAFPEGCVTTGLSPQEKVLAFMLFDISACVIPDNEPPLPPRVPH